MRSGKQSAWRADAVVVGGGVVGLALARELGRRGLHATVLERGRAGCEASGAAAGMLAPQAEADEADEFFRLQCAARDAYPALAEALREEAKVDIELDRTGTLYLALTEEDEAELERRYLWQSQAGLEVERLSAENALLLEPGLSPRVRWALRFPSDWQVENRRLVAALAESVKGYGGGVWEGVAATMLRVGPGGRVAGVETSHGFLSAPLVVLAAGAWTSRLPFARDAEAGASVAHAAGHPRVEPVRGQMLCFHPRPLSLLRGGHVIYSPRGYLVSRRDGRLLAGSTTERVGYNASVTAAGLHALTTHALEIAPAVGALPLLETWAGLRPYAADGRPVVGASEEVPGLFYSTGHYRNGILLAPLTGVLLAELIVGGRTPALLRPFTPERLRRACAV